MASSGNFFKTVRVTILLVILAVVGANTWLSKQRATDWQHPLRIVVYPINGDGSAAADNYIRQLSAAEFTPIETFFRREMRRYGLATDFPLFIQVAPPVNSRPPPLPRDQGMLKVMLWSLQVRLWAFRVDDYQGPAPEVRLFVQYFDPARTKRLDHSLGLEKGMIGVIKAFASAKLTARNNIVITHELLHTLGATDKYDLHTNQPRFPDGYADPERQPLYPQRRAEIMAGRIPRSPADAVIPHDLDETIVGPMTAGEIRWTRS